ncbi:MAG TPA: hypothetical protein VLS89_12270 [Candidatus Nanopelagicales bacterium]|nr:hypothetical protein [Candidatus Nanopelagicales bacterium]
MPTFEEQIQGAALLALIVTRMGKLVGRLRVQKLMYLLQQTGAEPAQPFFFQYHHYGPFSFDVADVINGSVRSRIVVELEDGDDDGWKRYEYRPAEDAEKYAARLDPASRALVEQVLAVCKDAHWRTLELAATADFLARADQLDRDTAFRDAIERKPQCARYEPEARRLLDALGL